MNTDSKEKIVLITGGSSGIGKATVFAMARQGATVIVADLLDETGISVVNQVKAQGGKAEFVHADMGDLASIENLFQTVEATYGRLDMAFNNAGIEGISAPTADCTLENWEHVIAVNLRSVWACMKHEIPLMLKHGGGSIVNCASIAGLVGFQGSPAYVASKHGVVGLTKTAALEYARQGIRVNAVCPGVIKTPMIDRFTGGSEDVEKQFADSEPMGRLGQPEEIAGMVEWLFSDQSTFVTGQAIAVDGGWVAQ